MKDIKSKILQNIEKKMDMAEPESLRHKVLESAKNFKISWIELGQCLYSAWKEKAYKSWGYTTFDIYTAKEIGIRKQTAQKLLRSYYFLEKEEPNYVTKEYLQETAPSALPTYEAVDILRNASDKKKIDQNDYEMIKNKVLKEGKSAVEVRKDLTAIIKRREEVEPQEARNKRRLVTVKRFLGTLRSLRDEIKLSKMLSAQIVKEADALIKHLESEI